jgi:diacylglycerol kinase (ATP)
MICSQHNAWIHVVATLLVVAIGFAMNVSRADWCWLVLCIGWVWTAEALNTAIECLADVASPEYHPLVRDAKDIAAGAVLVSAIAAAIIGWMVFWPHWMP